MLGAGESGRAATVFVIDVLPMLGEQGGRARKNDCAGPVDSDVRDRLTGACGHSGARLSTVP